MHAEPVEMPFAFIAQRGFRAADRRLYLHESLDRRETPTDDGLNHGSLQPRPSIQSGKIAVFLMAQKHFSLQEAQVLLPVLRSLLKQAIDGKKLIETIDSEFQELAQRIFLSGGLLVEIGKAATRRAERDKTVQRIKDVVAEIDATGVQVKDLDMGLLDFPCLVEGRTILLCWKMGEEKITHWHGVDEGYAGRKPVDETITKLKKKPN